MQVKTQIDDLQNYLTDASNMQGGHADKLFIPESADEIAQILRDANERKIPVTISGARTGTVGGAIPFGGYVISMERMNKIIEIDKEGLAAVVQSGVILGDLQKAVEAEGLFYPPDPTEWSCQIGGTVATNASGARSFRYGSTRRWVERLKIVLPTGDKLDIDGGRWKSDNHGRISLRTESGNTIDVKVPTFERPHVRKNVSGYFNQQPLDAIDLFIGSEGTLGVITEIELSLSEKPQDLFSGIVFFRNASDLLAFVDEAKQCSLAKYLRENRPPAEALSDLFREAMPRRFSGPRCLLLTDEDTSALTLEASMLEYFDGNSLKFISEKFPETPSDMAGAIFFEQETDAKSEDRVFSAWNELLETHNADVERSWFATNDQDRERMRAFRHALPVAVNERIAKFKQRKVGTDMAVPDKNFATFLQFYKETLDASGLDYVIFGHIGDCHLHANMLPKDAKEAEKARHIYGRCIAQAIMLDGTVSAEHGIGKLKRKYLAAMMGERYLNEMAELKRLFDPNGILGRGNMFDEKFLG